MNHLDEAIRLLRKQRNELDSDIRLFTKQRNKIDRSIADLSNNTHHEEHGRPGGGESKRRRQAVMEFCAAWAGNEFTIDDFMNATGEPDELRSAFRNLLHTMIEDNSYPQLQRIRIGKGKAKPLYFAGSARGDNS